MRVALAPMVAGIGQRLAWSTPRLLAKVPLFGWLLVAGVEQHR